MGAREAIRAWLVERAPAALSGMVLGVLLGASLGAALGFGLATGPPSYRTHADVVLVGVGAEGRGNLYTVNSYTDQRLRTLAGVATAQVVTDRAEAALGEPAGALRDAVSARVLTGTSVIRIEVTGADPGRIRAQALAVADAAAATFVAVERPPGVPTSRVRAEVAGVAAEVVDARTRAERLAAVLGAVLAGAISALLLGVSRLGPRMPWRRRTARLVDAAIARQWDTLFAALRTREARWAAAVLAVGAGGYIVTGSSWPPLLIAVAGFVAGLRDLRWAAGAVLVLAVSALPSKLDLVPVGPVVPTVLEVALAGAVGLTVLQWLRGRSGPPFPFMLPLLGVLAAMLLGLLVGFARGAEISELAGTIRPMLVVLAAVVLHAAFAGRPHQLLVLLLALAGVSTLLALLAMPLDLDTLLVNERTSVVTGTTTSAVSRLASPVLDLWTPLMVLLASGAVPVRPRWLFWVLAGLGTLYLLLSFNRSTWAPLLVAVIAVGVVRGGLIECVRRAVAFAITALLVLGLAATGLFGTTGEALASRAASIASGDALQEDSLADRLRENAAAWRTLAADPWFGTGVGLPYGAELATFDPLMEREVVEQRPWIHNQYLRVWLLFGAAGLVAFAALAVAVILTCLRAWWRLGPAGAVPVAAGLGLACAAGQAVFQTNLVHVPAVATVAAILPLLGDWPRWVRGVSEEYVATGYRWQERNG